MFRLFTLICSALCAGLMPSLAYASVIVSANSSSNMYALLDSKLGPDSHEGPDRCGIHNSSHVTSLYDDTLNRYVFNFHAHLEEDTADCTTGKSDRQRTEVKVSPNAGSHLKGSHGETHTYRWKFLLTGEFQPSASFTHIFQIKAKSGDDASMPLVTFTPRKRSSGDVLQLVHFPNGSTTNVVATVPLSQIKGEWIEAYVRTKYADNGTLHVTLRRIDNGSTLLNWSASSIDMWRAGGSYNRPKWGIYRSLLNASELRNEHPRFNDFCIAEGSDTCPSYFDPPEPPPSPQPCPYYDPDTGRWILCP